GAGPPSEPDVPVSVHPAQASLGGWRWWLQWRWTSWGAAASVLAVFQTTSIVLRLVASQCSQSRGVCGRSEAARSVALQIAQRPSWSRWGPMAEQKNGKGAWCGGHAQELAGAGAASGRRLLMSGDGEVGDE